ncbi:MULTISPECIES: NUDIX hydrolase [unclassified Microbacterium]|uniref:NUDIX hydrolase n=1 Tax=unclassified Microbacterium TaxID=2609290 RepID=UPI00300FD80B
MLPHIDDPQVTDLMTRAPELRKHLTVTGYTTDPTGSELLMVFHRKLGRWLPPGGHVEVDEFPSDAVLREVWEETGVRAAHRATKALDLGLRGVLDVQLPSPLTMSAQLIPPGPRDTEHIHIDMMFELVADPGEAVTYETREVSGARWFTRAEILREDLTFDAVTAYARDRMID